MGMHCQLSTHFDMETINQEIDYTDYSNSEDYNDCSIEEENIYDSINEKQKIDQSRRSATPRTMPSTPRTTPRNGKEDFRTARFTIISHHRSIHLVSLRLTSLR